MKKSYSTQTIQCIHLYHGDGKGKTTAAIGLTIRAAGAGKKVIFCQFLKSADTGELNILRNMSEVTILRCERKFGFTWTLSPEEKKELVNEHTKLLLRVQELMEEGNHDMVVFDEICDALNLKMVDEKVFYELLENLQAEVVLTGRNPDERLKGMADYITEMKNECHPYDKGISARRGIEF